MKLNEIDKEILTILNEARETKSGLYEGKADLFLVLNEKSKFRKGQFDYSIRKLKDNDFIKPLKARGVYKITDKGVKQLNGKIEEEEIFRDVEGTLKRRVKTIHPVIKRKTKEEKIAEAEEQLEKLKDRYVDATVEKKDWHDLQKISDQIEAKEGEVIRLKYGLTSSEKFEEEEKPSKKKVEEDSRVKKYLNRGWTINKIDPVNGDWVEMKKKGKYQSKFEVVNLL